MEKPVSNQEIAELLDLKDDNVFKIRAYRRTAQMIGGLERPLIDLMQSRVE